MLWNDCAANLSRSLLQKKNLGEEFGFLPFSVAQLWPVLSQNDAAFPQNAPVRAQIHADGKEKQRKSFENFGWGIKKPYFCRRLEFEGAKQEAAGAVRLPKKTVYY